MLTSLIAHTITSNATSFISAKGVKNRNLSSYCHCEWFVIWFWTEHLILNTAFEMRLLSRLLHGGLSRLSTPCHRLWDQEGCRFPSTNATYATSALRTANPKATDRGTEDHRARPSTAASPVHIWKLSFGCLLMFFKIAWFQVFYLNMNFTCPNMQISCS